MPNGLSYLFAYKYYMTVKRRLLIFVNGLLAGLLPFLGCSRKSVPVDDPPPCLYGVPTADFIEIKGSVTNEQQNALQNIEVVVEMESVADTLYTDGTGNFAGRSVGSFPYDAAKIYLNDPSGRYSSDTIDAEIEYKNPKSAWNQGAGTVSVNVVLKEKQKPVRPEDKKLNTDRRISDIRPLYGVPPAQWQKSEEKENRKNISETKDKNE